MANHMNAAMVAYDVVRSWSISNGIETVDWDGASQGVRAKTVAKVDRIAAKPAATAEEHHNEWRDRMAGKFGWSFAKGPKDREGKTRPDLLPFSELNSFEQMRARLFVAVVREILKGA